MKNFNLYKYAFSNTQHHKCGSHSMDFIYYYMQGWANKPTQPHLIRIFRVRIKCELTARPYWIDFFQTRSDYVWIGSNLIRSKNSIGLQIKKIKKHKTLIYHFSTPYKNKLPLAHHYPKVQFQRTNLIDTSHHH